MAAELIQRIIKLTDQEEVLLKEIVSNIRAFRESETKKDHNFIIGKLHIKIFNSNIELEAVNQKIKVFKG